MNQLVSIIIPVYNVEKYLEKCLLSVINQTYSNLEIILVNDGSTDLSLTLCEKFVEKDNRIILINQINSGVSTARNNGLDIAKGQFISFIDSDDYIELDMIEKLLIYANKHQVDIVSCGYNVFSESGQLLKTSLNSSSSGVTLDNEKALKLLFTTEILKGFLCNKLFKKECLNGMKLPKDLDICEDFYFVSKVLKGNVTVMSVTDRLYNHLHNLSGATKNIAGLFNDMNELKYLVAMNRIESIFPNNQRVIQFINQKKVKLVLETYLLMVKNKYRDKQKEYQLFKLLSENKNFIYIKEVQLKYKIAYICFYYYSKIRILGVKK